MPKQKNAVAPRTVPTGQERTSMVRASERVQTRQPPPAVSAQFKSGNLIVRPAHTDATGWCNHLKDTFGTASADFASMETDRLVSALGLVDDGAPAVKINAALAAVAAAKSSDEMEAMLASQMAATHSLIMDLLGRAKRAEGLESLEAYGGLANRLMRAYTLQVDALAKQRRGGEQTVRVEHVHVHAGGQAVVGNVNQGRREHGASFKQADAQGNPCTAIQSPNVDGAALLKIDGNR